MVSRCWRCNLLLTDLQSDQFSSNLLINDYASRKSLRREHPIVCRTLTNLHTITSQLVFNFCSLSAGRTGLVSRSIPYRTTLCWLLQHSVVLYDQCLRVSILYRMHPAFLSVRSLVTAYIYLLHWVSNPNAPAAQDRGETPATPDSNRLTFNINNSRWHTDQLHTYHIKTY